MHHIWIFINISDWYILVFELDCNWNTIFTIDWMKSNPLIINNKQINYHSMKGNYKRFQPKSGTPIRNNIWKWYFWY